jgi:flagellar assembly protein FliH
MQEHRFKISRKVTGIRSAEQSRLMEDETVIRANDAPETTVSLPASEHKALQDRIRVLEMELQKAREESFQAGYQEGKSQGLAEAGEQITGLQQRFAEQEQAFELSLAQLDKPLLELAVNIAELIIGQVVREHEDIAKVLSEKLSRMLSEVIDQNKIIVALSAEDLRRVDPIELKENLEQPSSADIKIVADKNLQSGECMVRTEEFMIDGTHRNQLNHVAEQLSSEDR